MMIEHFQDNPSRTRTLFFLHQLIQRLLQNGSPHGAHVIAVVQHGVGDGHTREPIAMQEAQYHGRVTTSAFLGLRKYVYET